MWQALMGAAAGGAATQGVTDMLNSALSAVQHQKNAKRNRGHEVEMFENRYQMTVRDLRKAGLNPMLAYIQGGGSPPASARGTHSGGKTSDYAGASYRGSRLAAELDLMREQAYSARAASRAQDAAANLTDARRKTEDEIRAAAVKQAREGAIATTLDNEERAADAAFYRSPEGRKLRMIQRGFEALPSWLGGAGAGLVGGAASARAIKRERDVERSHRSIEKEMDRMQQTRENRARDRYYDEKRKETRQRRKAAKRRRR